MSNKHYVVQDIKTKRFFKGPGIASWVNYAKTADHLTEEEANNVVRAMKSFGDQGKIIDLNK